MLGKIKNTLVVWVYFVMNFFANRSGVVILMYHRVTEEPSSHGLAISPLRFEEQMRYLKRFCHVVSLREVEESYRFKKPFPRQRKPVVAITLDDGYRDNFVNAFPILNKYGIPATVFLITGSITEAEQDPGSGMLTWRQVRETQGDIAFCPHTVHHPHLPKICKEEQKREIEQSMGHLAQRLPSGKWHKIFAYPYGEFNDEILDLLRELDMHLALTTRPGVNTGEEDPLLLKRVAIDPGDDLRHFIRKVSGGF